MKPSSGEEKVDDVEEMQQTTDGDKIQLTLRTKTIILDIKKNAKGHCLYLAEVRTHFPLYRYGT